MNDESKALESLGRTLERLEKVLERVEKQLEKLEPPGKESAGKAEEPGPFAGAGPIPSQFPFDGEEFGRHMEQVGREMERQFGPGRPGKTEEYKLSDFSSIEAGGTFDIEIVRADSYSVSVTADEELFNNLEVERKNDKLEISHARHIGWFSRLTRPKVRITLPILRGLEMKGASRATIKGFSSTENFKLEMSGASRVTGELATGNAQFELSGASSAELTGSAKDVIIEASGANHLDLGNFSAHNLAVKLSGAIRCSVKVEGRLDARLSGASRLDYAGNPVMGDIRTSGASRISKR